MNSKRKKPRGAHGLYLDDVIGNFTPGKEADFVALDWNGGP